jgi:hypothetical protein
MVDWPLLEMVLKFHTDGSIIIWEPDQDEWRMTAMLRLLFLIKCCLFGGL